MARPPGLPYAESSTTTSSPCRSSVQGGVVTPRSHRLRFDALVGGSGLNLGMGGLGKQDEVSGLLSSLSQQTNALDKLHQEVSRLLTSAVEEKAAMENRLQELKDLSQQQLVEERITTKQTIEKKEAALFEQLAECKAECERNIANEKALAKSKVAEVTWEWERRLSEERERMMAKLAESQKRWDEEIHSERRSTQNVLVVLRELPPLQAAMVPSPARNLSLLSKMPRSWTELGDLDLLERELAKWKVDAVDNRFGECRGVVEAVIKMAKERLLGWKNVELAIKEALKQVDRSPMSTASLAESCHRLFRSLKEAQWTRLDLRRSSPKVLQRICEVLLAWQERAMSNSNSVQKLLIRKVINWPQLGSFDFADLDVCLRLVDRQETGHEVFLSRARAILEDEAVAPKNLRGLLSHVETMLFFLKYTKAEDLRMAHAEFRKQRTDPAVQDYLRRAEREYPPGSELVRMFEKSGDLLEDNQVTSVLEEIRVPRRLPDPLGIFRSIFYHWAIVMRSKFDLLVLPHHTQVICLLAFRSFLESSQTGCDPHALIAQVGTGEGKSMIIAALAIYVVVALGKKAHVVVDDETLLERDFWTFKSLFDAFTVPVSNSNNNNNNNKDEGVDETPDSEGEIDLTQDGSPTSGHHSQHSSRQPQGRGQRRIVAKMCVSEDQVAAAMDDSRASRSCLTARVDPTAEICYCEAKHVQSFYAAAARGEQSNFHDYEDRVLILDEVDALIIDEEPNEAFVYPNENLSQMATSIAQALASGSTPDQIRKALLRSPQPASERVLREMTSEWQRGRQLRASDDFVYCKEIGRYCMLQGGRVNPKAWSLALECRNFQDGLIREILFQERLFVMSRPRVFRKYHRILGLSGSIGSDAERTFLKQTYRASFFEVPPFLKTCRGSPFHEAVPVALGPSGQAVYVEATPQAQLTRLAEVAFSARERVPVLVIARDRAQCDQLLEGLRAAARSRGFGSLSDDLVRSLSRTLYEQDPTAWKDNLNRSTLPMGQGDNTEKCWRITITDPRGGRGTDYRVDDASVDAYGGLLLIPTAVPSSQRDWTQFLGRTARQDRRGQYCAVLCSSDYAALSSKFGEALPSGGPGTSLEVVDTILRWGDREVAGRIKASAALYNCGVRVNEVCEELFSHRPELLKSPSSRESVVDLCQRLRWMSVSEINQAASRIPDFDPSVLPSEARDLGRPAEPPPAPGAPDGPEMLPVGSGSQALAGAKRSLLLRSPLDGPATAVEGPPKVVIFCLDWSLSMLSQDTGTHLSRFQTSVACIRRILRDQVRSQDFVGVIGFGAEVEIVSMPTAKGAAGSTLDAKIASLQAQMLGGTAFFDAVLECLKQLDHPMGAHPQAPRWLVCLTDGDDLGSRRENSNGELVTRALESAPPPNLSMIMITVGKLKEKNVRVIDGWVDRIASAGGFAQHLSEKNAAAITTAFNVVAECLAADLGGANEC